MADGDRTAAMKELVRSIKDFQDAVSLFHATAARWLGVNATDLRCLTALKDHGPLTASAVAAALGITRGATTTALDRLETAGLLQRLENAADGRSCLVRLTPVGEQKITAIWDPMHQHGRLLMDRYSGAELAVVTRFMRDSWDLQTRCMADLNRSDPVVGQQS